LFIQTWVELLESAFVGIAAQRRDATPLIFTAHSLPMGMAARSPYVEQLNATARRIAEKLGHTNWKLAYQSRSGKPGDPWLEPDVSQVIRAIAAPGARQVVVAPIGFVCDHVEVLYDLDIEAKRTAAAVGIGLVRASCPNDHPTFIRMMSDVIKKNIEAVEQTG
jgi:ferrochelatase